MAYNEPSKVSKKKVALSYTSRRLLSIANTFGTAIYKSQFGSQHTILFSFIGDKMTTKDEIHDMVIDCLKLFEDNPTLGDEESLILSGRLSSMGLVELIAKLEAHFNIDLISQGINPLDFDTINSIVRILQRSKR